MIKIGLVQAPSVRDIPDNLETIRQYAQEASQQGCQVLCFPECFLTGYAPEEAGTRAVSSDSPALLQLTRFAGVYDVDLLVGFMEHAENAYYITHGIFRKNGTRDIYRKTHLGTREQQYFSAGDELKVFLLSDGTAIGIQLCVENHYPQITQTLALRGAEIVFAPHAVPRVSGDRAVIWGTFIPARSYDNRIYTACCNLWDKDRFGGGCLVTDPKGFPVAECFEDHPALLVCSLDPDLVASYRKESSTRSRHFYPALRRKELYE